MPRPNGYCRLCRQPVLLATTAAGRTQPLNPEPDPAGNVAVHRDATGTWRSRVPSEELPAHPWEHVHMPHQATCTGPAPLPPPRTPAALPQGVASLAEHRRKRRTPRR
jgi:hypothetical protein